MIKNGWSEETAIEMDPNIRMAVGIIIGEFEGGEFDWMTMKWKKK